MFGDKADYEKHARNALPILIERAKKGDPIDYHKLREMLGIPYYNRSSQYIGNLVFLKSTQNPLSINDLSIRGYENAKKCSLIDPYYVKKTPCFQYKIK